MENLRFYSFKISANLDLDSFAAYFKFTRPMKWTDHIFLDNHLIEGVLKKEVVHHGVYLYEYGVVTFVGFHEDEMREMLDFFSGLREINYVYFAKFYAYFTLSVGDYGEVRIGQDMLSTAKEIQPLVASLCAKSAGLMYMETALEEKMNRVAPLLHQMSLGKVRIDRHTQKILGEIIAFKYNLLTTLKIFDKDLLLGESTKEKEAIRQLAKTFNLEDRYEVAQKKLDELRKMLYRYYSFHHNKKERSLYLFEVFLLAMFPLSYFVKSSHIKQMLQQLISFLIQG